MFLAFFDPFWGVFGGVTGGVIFGVEKDTGGSGGDWRGLFSHQIPVSLTLSFHVFHSLIFSLLCLGVTECLGRRRNTLHVSIDVDVLRAVPEN